MLGALTYRRCLVDRLSTQHLVAFSIALNTILALGYLEYRGSDLVLCIAGSIWFHNQECHVSHHVVFPAHLAEASKRPHQYTFLHARVHRAIVKPVSF